MFKVYNYDSINYFKDKTFFILSGEESTLPHAELKALVQSQSEKTFIVPLHKRVILVGGVINDEVIIRKGAYVRFGGKMLGICQLEELGSFFHKIDFAKSFSFRTFAVRVINLTKIKKLDGLEAEIGYLIKNNIPNLHVTFEKPDIFIIGVAFDDKFLIGTCSNIEVKKCWIERRPRAKPYFHPSALYPKFARCLINLLRLESGAIILDPFCGTGSILIEAAVIGLQSIGVDISKRMCVGAMRNIKHYGATILGVLQGDALKICLNKVDGVVTDIPYGRCSSTLYKDFKRWVPEFIENMHGILNHNRYCCIVHPQTLHLDVSNKFNIIEEHNIYIHRSLTRTVSVLRRI